MCIYLELIANSTLGNLILSGIANSVFDKGSVFNGPGVLSSAFDKAKLFAENLSKNSNLDDSGISLPVFPCRTNLKLHNISVTPKMVEKVIKNRDLLKAYIFFN